MASADDDDREFLMVLEFRKVQQVNTADPIVRVCSIKPDGIPDEGVSMSFEIDKTRTTRDCCDDTGCVGYESTGVPVC